MLLFEGAIKQYIDENGKTRMLIYRDKVSLMTSPIPPLDLPVIKNLSETVDVKLSVALAFIKRKELQITSQDGNEKEGIQGVWVEPSAANPGIYYGYIPVEKGSPLIKNVEYPSRNDPLRTDSLQKTALSSFRRSRKIAEFLKQYTLYTYAISDVEFGPDSYAVIPNHRYDIDSLHKKLYMEGNNIMYTIIKRQHTLIVPSIKTRDHLLSYLEVRLAHDKPSVMAMKDQRIVDHYYLTVSDFRHIPNQLVFMSKNGLIRWRNEKVLGRDTETIVSTTLEPNTLEPYFYRNPKIRSEHLMIVQNVEGGAIQKAISVGYKWIKDRVNIGSTPDIPANIDDISYTLFSETTNLGTTKRKTSEVVSVIRYGDKDVYGALLFFN